MTKKIITGLIIAILLAISLSSLLTKEEFSLPPKLIVLFILLLIAMVALKLKRYWLRYPILITSIAYLGFYEGSCVCPNGALQNIPLFLATSKYANIGIYLFEIVVIFAVIFLMGNLYCGWVCHKGGIQEFLFRKKLAIKIPEKIDRVLRNFRFLFLGIVLAYPIFKHAKFFGKIDPFKVIFNLYGTTTLTIILAITLLASIFIYRPFCRYVCPFGGLAGIVNSLGFFKLQFNGVCKRCRICENSCFFDAIKTDNTESPAIARSICISCMECAQACPKKVLEEKKIFGKTSRPQKDVGLVEPVKTG